MSRRGWLTGAFLRRESAQTAETPAARARPALPILRPPGALPEAAFLATCTACGDCSRACPHDALIPATARHRGAAGTPTFDPMRQPCWLCEDMPCAAACEVGALSPELPAKMGTARINPLDCLVTAHLDCAVCSERCPVPWAITRSQGRPRVDPRACVGCGVCAHVCPAPTPAILLVPRRPEAR